MKAPRDDNQVAMKVSVYGFSFDLVPTISFGQDKEVQRECAQEMINESNQSYKYSPALTEAADQFVAKYTDTKTCDGYRVRQFIRLVKLWNRTIEVDGYISGRSLIFELIAIHIWTLKEKEKLDTLSKLFLHFLKLMKSFRSLRVSGSSDSNNNQTAADSGKLNRPIIQHPVNEKNDLGKGIGNFVDIFEGKAEQWLEKLGANENNGLNGDQKIIQELVCSWRQPVVDEFSAQLSHCEWLLFMRNNRCPHHPSYVRRRKIVMKPRIDTGLLLALELLLYRHPGLPQVCTMEAARELLVEVLSKHNASSGLLTMQTLIVGLEQRLSSKPTLRKIKQIKAYLSLPSVNGDRKSVV